MSTEPMFPESATAQDVADLVLASGVPAKVLSEAAGIILGEAVRRGMIEALSKPGDGLWRDPTS